MRILNRILPKFEWSLILQLSLFGKILSKSVHKLLNCTANNVTSRTISYDDDEELIQIAIPNRSASPPKS